MLGNFIPAPAVMNEANVEMLNVFFHLPGTAQIDGVVL
jgi:hypothetical protein